MVEDIPYHLLRVGSKCDLSISELLFVPTNYWSMTSTLIKSMSSMASGYNSFPPCFKIRFPVLMCMRNIFILRIQVMQLFRHLSKDYCITSCVKCCQDQGFFLNWSMWISWFWPKAWARLSWINFILMRQWSRFNIKK